MDSKASIHYSGRTDKFKGRVRTPDDSRCKDDRVVVVKKKKPGRDRQLGATLTNAKGKWDLGQFKKPDGKYYAVAKRRAFEEIDGDTIVCRKGRSKTINL